VVSVERQRKVLVELRPVSRDSVSNAIEGRDGQAARILFRLQHERRHSANENSLGDAFRSVTSDVASYFAASGRVTDVNCVLQIKMFSQRCEIVGIGVHLVPIPRLAGAPMTAAVVRENTIALPAEEQHLGGPVVRA